MKNLILDTPTECGVILLSGTPLFPNSSMDLNIFEARYRKMLSDSLEGSWMFVVGSLYLPEELPLDSCVSDVATLVLVNLSKTLPDGSSALVITGLQPVRINHWIDSVGYPKANITLLEREKVGDKHAADIKELLMDSLPEHLRHLPEGVRSSVLSNIKSIGDVSAMIDNISHNFISDTDSRSKMLSEMNDAKRASLLISILSS